MREEVLWEGSVGGQHSVGVRDLHKDFGMTEAPDAGEGNEVEELS